MIIFVALALIQETFNQQTHMTTKNTGVDTIDTTAAKLGEDYNVTVNLGPVANVPTGWKIEECPLSGITVTNATGTALTVTTDYTLNVTTGVLNVLNTTATRNAFGPNNNSIVTYSFCEDGYNKDSGSRGIAGTIGLFAVIALFIIVAGFAGREWLG